MICTSQENLPNVLRNTFNQTLRPDLIALLKHHLPPSSSTPNHVQVTAEALQDLVSVVEDIRKLVTDSKDMQQKIADSLRCDATTGLHSQSTLNDACTLRATNTQENDLIYRANQREEVKDVSKWRTFLQEV
jgi:hypothetical protein